MSLWYSVKLSIVLWCSAAVYIQLEILKVCLFIVTKSLLYWAESIRTSWLLWKMCCVCSSLNPNTTHCVVGVSSHVRAGLREAPPLLDLLTESVTDSSLSLSFCLSLSYVGVLFSALLYQGRFIQQRGGGMCVVAFVLESIRGPGRRATSAWAGPWFTAASPRLLWCIAGTSLKDSLSVMLIVCEGKALTKGLACIWSLQRNRRPCIPLSTSPARRCMTRGGEKRVKFAPSVSSKEYTFQESNAFMLLPRNLYHKEQRERSQGLFSLSLIEFDRPFNMQPSTFLNWFGVRCHQGPTLKLFATPANGEWFENMY